MKKSVNLSDKQRAEIVRSLVDSNTYETGIKFGLDKYFKDSTGVKNKVYQVYQQVAKDPVKFGMTQEFFDSVAAAMKSRLPATIGDAKTLREKLDENKTDIKDSITNARDKVFTLINRKLDRALRTNSSVDDIKINELTALASMVFDKSRVIQGEATEHVAVMSKLDPGMTPEAALQLVLNMREANQADKEKKKK